MQIRFADNRPTGDFALVLPVAGKNRAALDSLGEDKAKVEAAIKRAEEQISKDLPPQELILLEKQLRYEKLKLKERM